MKNCVVLYCRVSTEEQTENTSLPAQLRECREAAKKLDCEVLKEFIEEGESGAKLDRTAMTRMLVFCTKNKAKVRYVIVKDIDRFSRDTLVHLQLRRAFTALGIGLYSINQPSISEETSESQFLENIFSAVAQLERSKIHNRTQKGTQEVLLRGGWTCQPPYGYCIHRREDNLPTLSVIPEQAKAVVKAFEHRAEGLPLHSIQTKLNALGYRSRQGKALSVQTIDNWLKNPVYIGKLRNKNFPDRLMDAAHPSIVSIALWNRAQEKIGKKTVLRQKFNPAFPLTTILRCEKCNTPITGSLSRGKSGKKYAYYHCRKAKCKTKNLSRDPTEKAFHQVLRYVQFTKDTMDFIEKNIIRVWREKWLRQAEEGRKLDAQLAKLKTKREQVETKYIDDKISEDTYKRHLLKVDEEITTVGVVREQLLISESRIKELLTFTRSFMISISNTWENAVPMRKRLIQRVVFPFGIRLEGSDLFRTLELPLLVELSKVPKGRDSALAGPRRIELRLAD